MAKTTYISSSTGSPYRALRNASGIPFVVHRALSSPVSLPAVYKGNAVSPTSFTVVTSQLRVGQNFCFNGSTNLLSNVYGTVSGMSGTVVLYQMNLETNAVTSTTIFSSLNGDTVSGLSGSTCVDSNGKLHVVFIQGVANMGTTYQSLYYTNNVSGSWSTPIEIVGHTLETSFGLNQETFKIEMCHDDRPYIVGISNALNGYAMYVSKGNLNNATSFELRTFTNQASSVQDVHHPVDVGDWTYIFRYVTGVGLVYNRINNTVPFLGASTSNAIVNASAGGLHGVVVRGTEAEIFYDSNVADTSGNDMRVITLQNATPTFSSATDPYPTETQKEGNGHVYGRRYGTFGSDGVEYVNSVDRPEIDLVWKVGVDDSTSANCEWLNYEYSIGFVSGTSSINTSTTQVSSIGALLEASSSVNTSTSEVSSIRGLVQGGSIVTTSTSQVSSIVGIQVLQGTSNVNTSTSVSSNIDGVGELGSLINTSTTTTTNIDGSGELQSSTNTSTTIVSSIQGAGTNIQGDSSINTSTSVVAIISGTIQETSSVSTSTTVSSDIDGLVEMVSVINTSTSTISTITGSGTVQGVSNVNTSTSVSSNIIGSTEGTSTVNTQTTTTSNIQGTGFAIGTSSVSTSTTDSSNIEGLGEFSSAINTSTTVVSDVTGTLEGTSTVNTQTSTVAIIQGDGVVLGISNVTTSTSVSGSIEGLGEFASAINTSTTSTSSIEGATFIQGNSDVNTSTTSTSVIGALWEATSTINTSTSQISLIQGDGVVLGVSDINTQTSTISSIIGFEVVFGASDINTQTSTISSIEGRTQSDSSINTQTTTSGVLEGVLDGFTNIFTDTSIVAILVDGSNLRREQESKDSPLCLQQLKNTSFELSTQKQSTMSLSDTKISYLFDKENTETSLKWDSAIYKFDNNILTFDNE